MTHQTDGPHGARGRETRRVATIHYLQMLLAMGAGMLVLLPVWALATRDLAGSWTDRPETPPLVMATAMAAGMTVWMRWRHHAWRDVTEMSVAMYAGFLVLFPFLWVGVLDGEAVVGLGHVLMLAAMAVPVVARPDVYALPHAQRPPAVSRPERGRTVPWWRR